MEKGTKVIDGELSGIEIANAFWDEVERGYKKQSAIRCQQFIDAVLTDLEATKQRAQQATGDKND